MVFPCPSTPLTRVVAVEECELSRIVPCGKYRALNRMNPESKFYGYYVIAHGGCSREDRIRTGMKEVRAERRGFSYVSSCEFFASKELRLAKLKDDIGNRLSFSDNKYELDIMQIKSYYGIKGGTKGKREIADIYAYNLALEAMRQSEIFAPIEVDRYFHYAPFHVLAEYFEDIGYDGIIYPSSVSIGGVNVAIFNPSFIVPDENSLKCNIPI